MNHEPMPSWLVLLFAAACGAVVANLYYTQPLIGLIAPDIGLPDWQASFIVTLTQLGYCAGMILLVPLGDLLENRRLVLSTLLGAVAALALAAVAMNPGWFLAASLLIGIGSVSVQMLVPMAAHMAPDATRGKIVGMVTSGLLTGIMLARPAASMIASALGWRWVFGLSALLMVTTGAVLWRFLPERRPQSDHDYRSLITSLWTVLRGMPLLRRRGAYQAMMFGAFTLYWTVTPLLLAGPDYGFSQRGIALFALSGLLGVIGAPVGGHLADKGLARPATLAAFVMAVLAFAVGWLGASGSVAALVLSGVLLDFAVQVNLVVGQREVYTLGAHLRSRLNALYLAMLFVGGALGSSLASATYQAAGWSGVCGLGMLFPLMAMILFFTERKQAGGTALGDAR